MKTDRVVQQIDGLKEQLTALDTQRQAAEQAVKIEQVKMRYLATDDDKAELQRLQGELDQIDQQIVSVTGERAIIEREQIDARRKALAKLEKERKAAAGELVGRCKAALKAKRALAEKRAQLLPELVALVECWQQGMDSYLAEHKEFTSAVSRAGEMVWRAPWDFSEAVHGLIERAEGEQSRGPLGDEEINEEMRRRVKNAVAAMLMHFASEHQPLGPTAL